MHRCCLALLRHPSAVAAALLAGAVVAHAQPFEFVYGAAPATEQAGRRATPVRFCPGEGGSIAVGTRRGAGLTPDVYVVRAGVKGGTIWERTYDLGPGGSDSGESLAQMADGSGFVITGSTLFASVATGLDAFLEESVAAKIANHSHIPLLLIRIREATD